MNKAVFGTLAVLLLAATPASAGARDRAPATAPAFYPGLSGVRCSSLWAHDPAGGEAQTGVVWGGPLSADDTDATISMRCSVQVGSANDRHPGLDVVSVESGDSTGRAVIPPTPASYLRPAGQPAYLCTEATVAGVTHYWNASGDDWSTSSSGTCSVLFEPGEPGDPVEEVEALVDGIYRVLDALCAVDLCLWPSWWLDPLLCPILVSFAPGLPGVVDIRPEGDVYVGGEWLWDCPPYGTAP